MGSHFQLEAPPSERKMFDETMGMRDMKLSLAGPRSRSRTDTFGSSLNREVRTQPAVPPFGLRACVSQEPEKHDTKRWIS
ncbi:hypothetical protein BELL_0018g00070 [Botrytis elliptica]|uniref:Uncharacterized protein n=1 Tax=Botrytis elliptica TaxID=278938 RepID=A0A4Z1K366_9HELO|nr:hypothetical protein BELL_0018g00070 [Botrytis elliptica]